MLQHRCISGRATASYGHSPHQAAARLLQGQNIVALATSGFGVLGAIVGAYFGVRAANRAVDKIKSSGAGA
jgi:hypothetical protein